MKLDAGDWEKINASLIRLYRERNTDKHTRVMLDVLNELVPTESGSLSIYRPSESFQLISRPQDLATEAVIKAALTYIHQSPFGPYYFATQDATWMRESDLMPIEDFHDSQWYHGFLKPHRVNYQIACILAVMEGTGYFITLHREKKPFTDREREVLNTLHPHLVTSFVNALAHRNAQGMSNKIKAAMETAPGAYGYFNPDGKVAWMQPKAQAWLLEFFPEEVKAAGNLPLSISRMLETSIREGGVPQQLERASKSDLLIACLGSTPLGGWILRLDRKPLKAPPRFRPLPQLSPAENRVLKWMVEGKRNSEIANTLCLSSRTVEKHAAQILTKLFVENRASAIIRAMELTAAANHAP